MGIIPKNNAYVKICIDNLKWKKKYQWKKYHYVLCFTIIEKTALEKNYDDDRSWKYLLIEEDDRNMAMIVVTLIDVHCI